MNPKIPKLVILIPETEKDGIPAYKILITETTGMISTENHFPEYIETDYPAVCTDIYAREILALDQYHENEFHVIIDLPEFLDNVYPWLPFTFALHGVILSSKCKVYFRGMNPVEYSKEIDKNRSNNPLDCIRNFIIYLRKKDDRSERVYAQTASGSFESFKDGITKKYADMDRFSQNYLYWLMNPYGYVTHDRATRQRIVVLNHPFDHLPIKNSCETLRNSYFTASQLKAKKITNLNIEKAVLMHDQIKTVKLRPYWKIEDAINPSKEKPSPVYEILAKLFEQSY